jgi:hypothetical protein
MKQKIELFNNLMSCTINRVKLVHVLCYHFGSVGVMLYGRCYIIHTYTYILLFGLQSLHLQLLAD